MENINIGITLLVVGMSVVFAFLIIMIIVMNITTKVVEFINKYLPEPVSEEKYSHKKKTKQSDDEAEIALVIAAAMREKINE